MRARAAVGPRSGPFLLPARVLLLVAGVVTIGVGVFNLLHEFHFAEVDIFYTTVAIAVFVVWLGALIVAFTGARVALFISAIIAFLELGIVTSAHFVAGTAALSFYVKSEGLPVATADMALVPLCILVLMSVVVCWSHPRGRATNLETLPILVVAVLGAIFVILQATDDVHRTDFGSANPEDGAFAAAVLASAWLAGALWIPRVRRTGASLIAAATALICYSFITLHITGGTSVRGIVAKSGPLWGYVAAVAAILAGASFLLSLGLLLWSYVGRRRATASAARSQPVRRGA